MLFIGHKTLQSSNNFHDFMSFLFEFNRSILHIEYNYGYIRQQLFYKGKCLNFNTTY